MKKFNSPKLIRRCRNVRGLSYVPYAPRDGERRERQAQPETCNVAFGSGISTRLRRAVLDDRNMFCRMCGVIPGDIDDLTEQKVDFHIGKNHGYKHGAEDELSSLRVLCSTCYEGARELELERSSRIGLLSRVCRAGQDTRRSVTAALLKIFGEER